MHGSMEYCMESIYDCTYVQGYGMDEMMQSMQPISMDAFIAQHPFYLFAHRESTQLQ